jgi:transcriptional regulator with XRE-family HTH domain
MGVSQSELGKISSVVASHISRLEAGVAKVPSQAVVEKLAAALSLTENNKKRFFESAGYAYHIPVQYSSSDPTVLAVLEVLRNPQLAKSQKEDFRLVIELICENWNTYGK